MIAVTRLRVPSDADGAGPAALEGVLAALAGKPGFVRGRVGVSVDEPDLLVLMTEWSGAGSYRRGLSGHDVKIAFADLMSYVIDEPNAFEVLSVEDRPEG